jgi:hypothetical protein
MGPHFAGTMAIWRHPWLTLGSKVRFGIRFQPLSRDKSFE